MRANMMYYHIYLYHGNKHNYHYVITQTLQNGQTLGQFFELLYVEVTMKIWDHKESIKFFVTKLGKRDIFLGYTWLRKHNPEIDWINK